MSRSLGDKLAHTVGVIPEPGMISFFNLILDFSYFELMKEEYEYVIISASDGLWDQASNERVREILKFYFNNSQFQKENSDEGYCIQQLCNDFVQLARNEWLCVNN